LEFRRVLFRSEPPNFLFSRALEIFSNRRSELLTNRTEKKVKIGKCQGLFVMPTFVPFALDTFIATFFDCLSRAIAGPHVPQYGSDLILYIVFIELLTLPRKIFLFLKPL